ncbi:MAG: hypothetical protein CMF46_04975 [Legionellales bacterium]|nr:hypothetical protein [Legionellales bacterium]
MSSLTDRAKRRPDFRVRILASLEKFIVFIACINYILVVVCLYYMINSGGERYFVTRPQGQLIEISPIR